MVRPEYSPQSTLSGFGLASTITYSNFEVLFLGLGSGADRLLIQDTHGDQTTVDAGPGADQVHVRTLAGPTFIRGNAGDDRVSAGTNFDASLFDAVIDHANAPPGGTIDLLKALLRVDGGDGQDTVNLDDSGDGNDNVGTVTDRTVDGLDLQALRVQTVTLTHAAGGTFTLTVGSNGPTTGPLAYLIGAAELRAALLALGLPEVTDVVVNRADNVFTIGFLGTQQLANADLTLVADAAGLIADSSGTPASIAVQANAVNLVQMIRVPATSGAFLVTVGNNVASFTLTVGDSADTVRDALIAAIESSGLVPPVNGVGLGVNDVTVDRVGDTYVVGYQGLLRGVAGAAFGLHVAPASTIAPQPNGDVTLTINAIGGSFTLSAGPGQRTYALGFNASAARSCHRAQCATRNVQRKRNPGGLGIYHLRSYTRRG